MWTIVITSYARFSCFTSISKNLDACRTPSNYRVCRSDISWLPDVQWPVQGWCLLHSPSPAFDYAIWKLKTLPSHCPETMERTSGGVKGCCQLASQPPLPLPPHSSRCIIGETIINPFGRSSRKLLTILIRFQWRSRILLFLRYWIISGCFSALS